MAAGEHVIELPQIADGPNRPWQAVDHAIGKPLRTRLRVAGYEPALDPMRVDHFPETGRSHQLRVHLLAIGHPILGEELYAPPGFSPAPPAARGGFGLFFTRRPQPSRGWRAGRRSDLGGLRTGAATGSVACERE